MLVGAVLGAILAGVVAIAYNTSAQTAVLEGSRHHLTFLAVLGIMGLGAILGGVAGEALERPARKP